MSNNFLAMGQLCDLHTEGLRVTPDRAAYLLDAVRNDYAPVDGVHRRQHWRLLEAMQDLHARVVALELQAHVSRVARGEAWL